MPLQSTIVALLMIILIHGSYTHIFTMEDIILVDSMVGDKFFDCGHCGHFGQELCCNDRTYPNYCAAKCDETVVIQECSIDACTTDALGNPQQSILSSSNSTTIIYHSEFNLWYLYAVIGGIIVGHALQKCIQKCIENYKSENQDLFTEETKPLPKYITV